MEARGIEKIIWWLEVIVGLEEGFFKIENFSMWWKIVGDKGEIKDVEEENDWKDIKNKVFFESEVL